MQAGTWQENAVMGMWRIFRDNVSDRDYLRWRRKRKLIRLALTILSLVLLSPIITIYQVFEIRSALGFVFLVVCVLFLLAIYRALGWIGQPYIAPTAEVDQR
jgi:hypothetical protein